MAADEDHVKLQKQQKIHLLKTTYIFDWQKVNHNLFTKINLIKSLFKLSTLSNIIVYYYYIKFNILWFWTVDKHILDVTEIKLNGCRPNIKQMNGANNQQIS